jgi:hypothetical protein
VIWVVLSSCKGNLICLKRIVPFVTGLLTGGRNGKRIGKMWFIAVNGAGEIRPKAAPGNGIFQFPNDEDSYLVD